MGYRAITPEALWCMEGVPQGGDYHSWRIRRAQHLIQHFAKTLKLIIRHRNRANPVLVKILLMEALLHLVNPWLLAAATLILTLGAAMGSTASILLLITGISLLAYRPYRTWVASQAYLIAASIRNPWTKEITWEKVAKTAKRSRESLENGGEEPHKDLSSN
jgi:hypothetical protein